MVAALAYEEAASEVGFGRLGSRAALMWSTVEVMVADGAAPLAVVEGVPAS
jgi:hypothetical protein